MGKEDTRYGKSAYDIIEVNNFMMYGIGNMIRLMLNMIKITMRLKTFIFVVDMPVVAQLSDLILFDFFFLIYKQ